VNRDAANESYVETFTIRHLNEGWDWRDFTAGGCEYDYCLNELEIPEEYLLQAIADVYEKELEITLYGLSKNSMEEWLINLARLQNSRHIT
jgi:hypothetical protein